MHANRVTIEAISQAALEEFLQLKDQGYRYDAERHRLIDLIDAGVFIEPGPLSARLDRRPHRLLSAKALTPVLGPARVAELLAEIEPAIWRHLIVERTPAA